MTRSAEHVPWRAPLGEIQPILADLQALLARRLPREWPSADQLSQLLPFQARTWSGKRLHFVPARDERLSAMGYERTIHETGGVPTRTRSWHDTFNALIWALYPQAKAVLNHAHARDPESARRSRRRDALTLLDEVGVVIATCDTESEMLNRRHRWQELFVERRDAWWRRIRPFPFGHGLLEQCLAPYLGLTAKAIYLPVPAGFFDLPLRRQYALVDDRLAWRISHLSNPSELMPLPVLGVPGWDRRNEDRAFYDNREYFRPAPAN